MKDSLLESNKKSTLSIKLYSNNGSLIHEWLDVSYIKSESVGLSFRDKLGNMKYIGGVYIIEEMTI